MDMNMIAWAAGVLEGEGSFLTKTGGHTPIVSCQMTDLDVLEGLKNTFTTGTIHSTKKLKEHYKDCWVWRVSGNEALRVMDLIYPYMMVRRKAAIDRAKQTWYNRLDVVSEREARGLAAARDYLEGGGSLREVAKRHGTSYESVRRWVFKID